MSSFERYRTRRHPDPSKLVLLVACILALATLVIAHGFYEKKQSERDQTRMLQLRVEARDIANRLAVTPRDSAERPALERHLREVVAEHNAILTRHPTWTEPRLDTLANQR